MINLLDDAINQPSGYGTRNWVEINNESHGVYKTGSQIKFKTLMLRLCFCDYSDAYILVKGTITVPNTASADAVVNNANKKAIYENCATFTNCISELNDKEVGDAQDIVVIMPIYNLIENSYVYLNTSGSKWQSYGDETALDNNRNIIDFSANTVIVFCSNLNCKNITNRIRQHKRCWNNGSIKLCK